MKIYMAGDLGCPGPSMALREGFLIELKHARLFSFWFIRAFGGFQVWLDAPIWGNRFDEDLYGGQFEHGAVYVYDKGDRFN